jgi:hypothetical protein
LKPLIMKCWLSPHYCLVPLPWPWQHVILCQTACAQHPQRSTNTYGQKVIPHTAANHSTAGRQHVAGCSGGNHLCAHVCMLQRMEETVLRSALQRKLQVPARTDATQPEHMPACAALPCIKLQRIRLAGAAQQPNGQYLQPGNFRQPLQRFKVGEAWVMQGSCQSMAFTCT